MQYYNNLYVHLSVNLFMISVLTVNLYTNQDLKWEKVNSRMFFFFILLEHLQLKEFKTLTFEMAHTSKPKPELKTF